MNQTENANRGSGHHPYEMGEVLYEQNGEQRAVCPACLGVLFVLPSQPGDTKQIRYFCATCETRITLNADG